MVTVCAWCQRYLGDKDPKPAPVTHGICKPCLDLQLKGESPVLVVSRHRSHLVPILEQLLHGIPEFRVVVDRREGERRQRYRRSAADVAFAPPRSGRDRRQGAPVLLT